MLITLVEISWPGAPICDKSPVILPTPEILNGRLSEALEAEVPEVVSNYSSLKDNTNANLIATYHALLAFC